MHIFFSVGEPSGDQHAAELIRELRSRRPDLVASGFGGPRMQEAGCSLLYRLTDLAVMGFMRVVPLLWRFVLLSRRARSYFIERQPDAVVLVDFPGFNWWIARYAKQAGIPVFYYLPPQLWAWAPWRIRRVRRNVDHVLSGLTFECDWYQQRGVEAEFVGHPFFDEVAQHELDEQLCDQWQTATTRNVAVLPGSRTHEVTSNFPVMVEIMRRLVSRNPEIRFLVGCYNEKQRDWCAQFLEDSDVAVAVHLFAGKTPEVIQSSECALTVSGSVSLELLARTTPSVIIYRCGRLFHLIVDFLVSCEYASLPNLMAKRELMPEFVGSGNPEPIIAGATQALEGWITDHHQLDSARASLSALRDEVMQLGANAKAANAILGRMPATDSVRRAA